MNLYDITHEGNAEGYCPKCHMPLGITGICSICAVNESELFEDLLHDVFVCKHCGRAKTHHRLYGYRCDNPGCEGKR